MGNHACIRNPSDLMILILPEFQEAGSDMPWATVMAVVGE